MFWLEDNLVLSHVLITGESDFDEKNVEEVFNWSSEVHAEKKNTTHGIGTLVEQDTIEYVSWPIQNSL